VYTTLITYLLFYSLFKGHVTHCRSILRKSYKKKPKITACWLTPPLDKLRTGSIQDKKRYSLTSTQLQKNPIFKAFDEKSFYQNMLPEQINYRYDKNKYVTKAALESKLETLFKEIDDKNRKYKNFEILRKSNFNRRKKSGLLILKFKDYPFVVKVFMENPKNFVRPYSKGVYPIFFFNMGGGTNRHLLGFTRVNNLHAIQKTIANNPQWANMVETPRKWHWVPQGCKKIEIIGTNFEKNNIRTVIPGTYCIIADAIKLKNKTFSLGDPEAREMCMSLCNSVGVRIDPHIDNFLLEKGTDKLVIVDTEHFPSIVGLKDKQNFNGYFDWYFQLSTKCLNDMFFKIKKERYPYWEYYW